MQFITLFLLIGWLSIANANIHAQIQNLKDRIRDFSNKGNSIELGLSGYHLTLLGEGLYLKGVLAIWKGWLNDGNEVDVKFFIEKKSMDKEIAAYEALGATKNNNAREHGIPQIFYYGELFHAYAIVMEGLNESLLEFSSRWQGKFNEYTILQVFLQLVETLKYMHNKGVAHNNISPASIFLCGEKVFVTDFDLAISNGEKGCTYMNDLKSVIDSIWTMLEMCSQFAVEGPRNRKIKIATQNCKYFENYPAAKEACLFVCKDEALSDKQVPNYTEIIQRLKGALNYVKTKPDQKWIG